MVGSGDIVVWPTETVALRSCVIFKGKDNLKCARIFIEPLDGSVERDDGQACAKHFPEAFVSNITGEI